MKALLTIFTALSLTLGYADFAQAAEEESESGLALPRMVSLRSSLINVRSGPGKEYKSIGTLKKGKTATVVAETKDWYKIEYKDGYAYISKKYAKEVAPEKPAAGKTVTITTDLYVRSGPGKEYKAIGTLKKGKTVEVFEKKNGWYRMKFNGKTGYISAKYTQ